MNSPVNDTNDNSYLPLGLVNALSLIRKDMLGLDQIRQRHRIPLSHMQVLFMLERSGEASVTEISKRFGIAKSNITPMVKRLISQGYVDRLRTGRDLRVVNIILRPEGKEKLRVIKQEMRAYFQQWLDQLEPDIQDEVVKDLTSLMSALLAYKKSTV